MPVWPVYLFNALNVVTGCATLAVAKQLFNPANFMVREKDVKNLPSWYASNYTKSISKVGKPTTKIVQSWSMPVQRDPEAACAPECISKGSSAWAGAFRGLGWRICWCIYI